MPSAAATSVRAVSRAASAAARRVASAAPTRICSIAASGTARALACASAKALTLWRFCCRASAQPPAPSTIASVQNTAIGKPGTSPNPASTAAAICKVRGSVTSWATMSWPRLPPASELTRVTSTPAVSEIKSAGIWAISPSPTASSE